MPDLSALVAASPVVPPAPPVHAKDLPPLRLVLTSVQNSLAIWPDYAFDVPFNRTAAFGIESVLVNDPAGVHHVFTGNAANYVRPVIMPRILRPLTGRGVFLAEGPEWRRQRRMLAPVFTPPSVAKLLPHFIAAADELVRNLGFQHQRGQGCDLSGAFQGAALSAVLRALFSLPDPAERDRIGALVRTFVTGPGRPQVLDGFAKTETSFSVALMGRRAFQRRWFAAVDGLIATRRSAPQPGSHRDLLDLLLAVRDPETGAPLADSEVRDQAATMIFAGYETTARLLYWASYLLTLDQAEQARIRAEVAAFPPDRVATLEDLQHWPRLRLVLLEALRLYPPVPLLIRQPVADDVIQGEPVRRGTQVYIAPWVLHRHRKHWQHPTAFLPDRFAGQPAPWTAGGAYLPFGAGPRTCIGAVFAMAEAQIMLAAVLKRFAVRMEGRRPVLPVGRLTIQPDHAARFRLGT